MNNAPYRVRIELDVYAWSERDISARCQQLLDALRAERARMAFEVNSWTVTRASERSEGRAS